MAKQHILGIDVGGTKTAIVLFDPDGNAKSQAIFPTPKTENDFTSTLIKASKKVAAKHSLQAIGVGLPGSVDKTAGVFIRGGNVGWHNLDIRKPMGSVFSCPIYIENDANLAALAEAKLGSGINFETVLYITISTGVGTGITYRGKLQPPFDKSEGGMMVFAGKDNAYKRLEDLVSGPDFKTRFGKYGFDVIDPNIWDAFARDLAAGVFNMVTLINPDVVILGGGMSVHFDAFAKSLNKYVTQLNPGLMLTPPLKQAKYVEEAVSYGAHILAKQPPLH